MAAASSAASSRSISDAVCWAEVSAPDNAWMQALTCSGVGVSVASVPRLAGRTVVAVSSSCDEGFVDDAASLGDAVADGSSPAVCEGDGLGVGDVLALGVGVGVGVGSGDVPASITGWQVVTAARTRAS